MAPDARAILRALEERRTELEDESASRTTVLIRLLRRFGEAITAERLDAIPWTTRCMSCARRRRS